MLREVDYEDDQKADGGIVYQQILINAKLQIGNRGQRTGLIGRSPLWRRRSVVECNVNKE